MRPGAIEVDHRFHRLGDRVGFGHVLFLDDLDPGHFLQRLDGDGVRLVPTEIVARADIDDSHREIGGGESPIKRGKIEGCSRGAQARRT